jgi:predicted transposase YbfD/YdcC
MSVAMRTSDFRSHFESVEDPRVDRTKDHQLIDILFICVAATVAGADGPTDIEEFARVKLAWCRKFVPLKNGVPSHDTIGRVLAIIKPEQFQKAFLEWVASFAAECDEDENSSEPRFVPIDGKTLRGSKGAKHRSKPLHLVSAWATKQGLTLGQVAVDSKSNEITAIPKLLEMLELAGAIISIDAMGCQKEIAKQIVNDGGDYVLAVKDNQPPLAEAIREFFLQHHEYEDFRDYGIRQHKTVERSRGRLEERYYSIAPVPESMKRFRREFKGLKSIGQVISHTTRGNKQTSEVR